MKLSFTIYCVQLPPNEVEGQNTQICAQEFHLFIKPTEKQECTFETVSCHLNCLNIETL